MSDAVAPAAPAAPVDTAPGVVNTPGEGADSIAKPEAVAEPKPDAKPEAQPKPVFKLKVNGQERDLPPDELEIVQDLYERNPDRAQKYLVKLQKSQAAEQRLKEATLSRREAEDLKARMKADPWKALEEMGINPDEAAAQRVWEKLQLEGMTPEQRELHELKAKHSALEKERAAEKERIEAQQNEAETAKWRDHYANLTLETMKSAPDLPQTEETAQRMISYLSRAMAQGIELTQPQLVALVRDDYAKAFSYLKSLSPDKLVETLGEDGVKKIREFELAKLKQTQAPTASEPRREPAKQKANEPAPTFDEVMKRFKKNL
jgi:hypothetical protein